MKRLQDHFRTPRVVHDRDAVMREHIETVCYVDPVTGEEHDPPGPPVIDDPEGDADSDLGADDDE